MAEISNPSTASTAVIIITHSQENNPQAGGKGGEGKFWLLLR